MPSKRVSFAEDVSAANAKFNAASGGNSFVENAIVEENESESSDDFVVERVDGRNIIDGRVYYLLKWSGYGDDERTWEPAEKCSCDELIRKYEKGLLKRSEQKKRGRGRMHIKSRQQKQQQPQEQQPIAQQQPQEQQPIAQQQQQKHQHKQPQEHQQEQPQELQPQQPQQQQQNPRRRYRRRWPQQPTRQSVRLKKALISEERTNPGKMEQIASLPPIKRRRRVRRGKGNTNNNEMIPQLTNGIIKLDAAAIANNQQLVVSVLRGNQMGNFDNFKIKDENDSLVKNSGMTAKASVRKPCRKLNTRRRTRRALKVGSFSKKLNDVAGSDINVEDESNTKNFPDHLSVVSDVASIHDDNHNNPVILEKPVRVESIVGVTVVDLDMKLIVKMSDGSKSICDTEVGHREFPQILIKFYEDQMLRQARKGCQK